jgi:putative spermidine/putrescine transport system ATP-binding protein
MAFLTLEGIVKSYGNFKAIDGLNLEVRHGEFIALLGPSGCGKTTTLQSIAGFVQPTEGRIILDGRDITHVRPEQRGLGIVFQSYALFPHMTVAQNISFGLEMRGVAKAERGKRIDEALDLVRLNGLGERYPKALSGGQRQRVAIARALAIRNRNLLLLDEPMSNLDAKLREEMHIELRAIQKRLGHHDDSGDARSGRGDDHERPHRDDASRRDRADSSTPYDAYERPATPFASAFLGKHQRIGRRSVARNERCAEVEVHGHDAACAARRPASWTATCNVYIRPEKVHLANGDARVRGRIATRVFVGNQWLLEVETDSASARRATEPRRAAARGRRRSRPRTGPTTTCAC